MAVKLRLTRMGKTNRPFFRIIAVDSRARRDGPHLEILGHYDPTSEPAKLKVDGEGVLKWLRNGAQPTDTVRSLLRRDGIWQQFMQERQARKSKQGAVAQAPAEEPQAAEQPAAVQAPAEEATSQPAAPDTGAETTPEPELDAEEQAEAGMT